MLELVIFKPAFQQPSASGFCVKAIYLMQMSGLEWKAEYLSDPRSAPMGKLPMLRDGNRLIADSGAIQKHLETEHGIDFAPSLNARQRAIAHALVRMIEEHFYFVIVKDRWLNDENWKHVVPAYFGEVPAILRKLVTNSLRKNVSKGLQWMGIARYPEDMLQQRIRQDLDAVKDLLGDQKFLFGDQPCFADAAISAQLGGFASSPAKSAIAQILLEDSVLMQYIDRCSSVLSPAET